MSPLVIGLVIVAFAAVGWRLFRGDIGAARFVVRVQSDDPTDIAIKGEVPGLSHGDVVEFVGGLELPKGSKIWGVPDRDRLVLRFSSEVPENVQQRMRNFFYNAL